MAAGNLQNGKTPADMAKTDASLQVLKVGSQAGRKIRKYRNGFLKILAFWVELQQRARERERERKSERERERERETDRQTDRQTERERE